MRKLLLIVMIGLSLAGCDGGGMSEKERLIQEAAESRAAASRWKLTAFVGIGVSALVAIIVGAGVGSAATEPKRRNK